MRTIGKYIGAQKSLEGDTIISFLIDEEDLQDIDKLIETDVVLDVSKFSKRRSLNANAYFWKLCDQIAKKLGSDKDTVYLMMLKAHGVFETIDVIDEAVNQITELYRFAEEDYRYKASVMNADGEERVIDMISLRCYRGSHEYDTKQMAELIDGAVNDAHDLGIETWSEAEIENLIQNWASR